LTARAKGKLDACHYWLGDVDPVSSGCFRLVNDDVLDGRVNVGNKVIV
jgi:hypothetical protein